MSGSGYKLGVALAALLVSSGVAFASPAAHNMIPATISPTAAPAVEPVTVKQQIYESYKVTRELVIDVVHASKPQVATVRLTKGMEITVIEADGDAKLGDIIRIGTDSDGGGNVGGIGPVMPSDFWVRANDLLKAGLEQSEMSFDNVDPVLAEQDIDADPVLSEHQFVGFFPGERSAYPLRYVKQYLLRDGIVSTYMPGNNPGQESSTLLAFGFKKTKRTASNARLHDVCVYRGGNSGNGHIEIKLKEGWWYGYGFHGAATIKNRRLAGCFSKAPEKNSAHR